MPLKPGDKAPDFTLLAQDGKPFTLLQAREGAEGTYLDLFYPEETRS